MRATEENAMILRALSWVCVALSVPSFATAGLWWALGRHGTTWLIVGLFYASGAWILAHYASKMRPPKEQP